MALVQQQQQQLKPSEAVKSSISLKGSAEIICDYLRYAVNSILYQRGIYPPETFMVQQQYDIPLFVSEDPQIRRFLDGLLKQSEEWLLHEKVKRISMVIVDVYTNETIECWEFNVEYVASEGDTKDGAAAGERRSTKELKRIQQEIRDVMRQVSATVSYLPLIDTRCSFDVFVHATPDCDVPEQWDEAKPVHIANVQNVKLKSFSTGLHKMETVVSYKLSDC